MLQLTQAKKAYELTAKQKEANLKMRANRTTLAEGGSRSGKTFIILQNMCIRAMKEVSPHLVTRFRFNHCKQTICHQTMPKVLESLQLKHRVFLNKSEWFYVFPNGSEIWIGGLDDKDRTEKILGNEYSTIFFNEASQISYESYEIANTRLNAVPGLQGRIFIDYNPPSITHWGYKIFHKREFPDGRPVPDDDYAVIKMNPIDNMANLAPDYIERLQNLSASKRKRFIDGEYALDSGKLWKRAWIKYCKELPDMMRVVVGVDPSGSKTGDEVGIIVAGMSSEGDYFILEDYSLHGSPREWAEEVVAAYEKYQADVICAEKNFGGDMVEHTILTVSSIVNVKLVTASRGKIIRAEPISAMYEHGLVFHRTLFNDLEDEMCLYDPEESESPNRMDAMVWAMTELTEGYAGRMAAYDIGVLGL